MGMLERWRGFSLFQRVLLAILAAMIVGFGIAIPTVAGRKGIEYRDALLRFTQEGEVRRYTGRVDWKRTEFTVRPGGTVEYRWGDEFYGPYQVVEDPSAAPERWMAGLEIHQGGQTLFRGGLSGGSWPVLYDEEGGLFEFMTVSYGTSGGKVYDSTGRELTQRDLHAPGLNTVAALALQEPELAHRGNFSLYLLATLLAGFNMFLICFPGLMFRRSARWYIRDPEAAEPSDFYIIMERAEWVVFTGIAAALYCLALTAID